MNRPGLDLETERQRAMLCRRQLPRLKAGHVAHTRAYPGKLVRCSAHSSYAKWAESSRSVTVRCKDGEVVVSRELLRLSSPQKLEIELTHKKDVTLGTILEIATGQRRWKHSSVPCSHLIPVDVSGNCWQTSSNHAGPDLCRALRSHKITCVTAEAQATLVSKLRDQLSLEPGSVGYIAKWLTVAEQYQLTELTDLVMTWKGASSDAVQEALNGSISQDSQVKQPAPSTSAETVNFDDFEFERALEVDSYIDWMEIEAATGDDNDWAQGHRRASCQTLACRVRDHHDMCRDAARYPCQAGHAGAHNMQPVAEVLSIGPTLEELTYAWIW
ncbi:hypothetical protein HaLaN_29800 [Haematococcus lacustris]|uniref:Uncharacterized protein n=1 Tax=Haematococcus lacustris TaxID=44745 RepID=A0A6A0AF17_HAELA|nr:hypothetical protein HaLaN_29800 [Haematococcus lacustris]